MRFVSSLGALALALSLVTSASAAEPAKAPAAAPIKAQPAPAAKAAVKAKTVSASQLKPGTVVKAGATVQLLDGRTVQFGGAQSDGAECICDPACTDGKYCDGCLGCKE
jgi:hypothetical protein